MPDIQTTHKDEDSTRTRPAGLFLGRALLVLAMTTVALVAMSAVVFGRSADACGTCHHQQQQDSARADGSHADTTCDSCHAGLMEGLGLVGAAHALEGAVAPSAAAASAVGRVPDEACLECHSRSEIDVPVETGGLRMSHIGLDEAGYQCIDCHAALVHQVPEGKITGITMGTCTACHDGKLASDECETCHVEREASDTRVSRRDPEFAVTHGARWQQNHGLGDLRACGTCHEPEKCEKCHGVPLPHPSSFGASHGSDSRDAGVETCKSCHTGAFCTSCHGMEMPHPAGFLPSHSQIAKSYTDVRCMACHTTENCGQCHTRHAHPGRKDRLRPPADMYYK